MCCIVKSEIYVIVFIIEYTFTTREREKRREGEFFAWNCMVATCVNIISGRKLVVFIIINAYIFALTDMHICLL